MVYVTGLIEAFQKHAICLAMAIPILAASAGCQVSCNGLMVEGEEMERDFEQDLRAAGVVANVTCPARLAGPPGTSVKCTAQAVNGTVTWTVTLQEPKPRIELEQTLVSYTSLASYLQEFWDRSMDEPSTVTCSGPLRIAMVGDEIECPIRTASGYQLMGHFRIEHESGTGNATIPLPPGSPYAEGFHFIPMARMESDVREKLAAYGSMGTLDCPLSPEELPARCEVEVGDETIPLDLRRADGSEWVQWKVALPYFTPKELSSSVAGAVAQSREVMLEVDCGTTMARLEPAFRRECTARGPDGEALRFVLRAPPDHESGSGRMLIDYPEGWAP